MQRFSPAPKPSATPAPTGKLYAADGVYPPQYIQPASGLTPLQIVDMVPVPQGGPTFWSFAPEIPWGPLYQPLVQAGWADEVLSGNVAGGEFAIQAHAAVQTNASTTWTVDYGDSTPAVVVTTPAKRCTYSADNPPDVVPFELLSVPNHTYAEPGRYTITVTVGITGCDGTPGPATGTSFAYAWTPNGEGSLDALSEVRSLVPLATWTPTYGATDTVGTVVEAPTGLNPDYQVLPIYAYCAGPTSEPAGATFTLSCTTVSADPATPVTFSCQNGPCGGTFDQNPIQLTPGTMYGAPAATGVVHVTETMPLNFLAVSFLFVVTQGPHTTYAEADVITLQ